MKRRCFYIILFLLPVLLMLFGSCGSFKNAEKYSVELFGEKKDDMQKIADYLLNDTESSIIMIQKNKSVNSWNIVKKVDGVYWVSNGGEVTFDISYSGFVSRFLKENKIDVISVLREDECVEFHIDSPDAIAHSVVYTKTGKEPQNDPYLWKIKDLDDDWYYAEEKDTPRNTE